jgi:hypothetical protein
MTQLNFKGWIYYIQYPEGIKLDMETFALSEVWSRDLLEAKEDFLHDWEYYRELGYKCAQVEFTALLNI